MSNTIKSVIISAVTLASLSFAAVAQPTTAPAASRADQSATTVSESLQVQPVPQQPLVTQENVDHQKAAVGEPKDRPRGQSRTVDESKASNGAEKPLLEVRGF